MKTTVTFYRIQDNKSKINLICTKAEEAFRQEKRLLITVPNQAAAEYVDALLWRFSQESFIPHGISNVPTKEWIAITTKEGDNLNQASRVLHLCSTPSLLYGKVEEIYEFQDETDEEKAKLSEQKRAFYRSKES